MEHLGETILLPKVSPLPNTLAYYKRLPGSQSATPIPNNSIVKIYQYEGRKQPPPTIDTSDVTVSRQEWGESFQQIFSKDSPEDYNTARDILVEVTHLEGEMVDNPRHASIPYDETINDDAIIDKIRESPVFLSKLPIQLWDRPTFVKKFIEAKLPKNVGYIPKRVKEYGAARRTNFASSLNGLPLQRELQEQNYAHGLNAANEIRHYLGMAPAPALSQSDEDRITKHKTRGGRKGTKRRRYTVKYNSK